MIRSKITWVFTHEAIMRTMKDQAMIGSTEKCLQKIVEETSQKLWNED